jgi:hypothetical protein
MARATLRRAEADGRLAPLRARTIAGLLDQPSRDRVDLSADR